MKRDDYKFFREFQTRWEDNDQYGHVNNVKYHSYFDSTINMFQIEVGQWDPLNDNLHFYVVNSNCDFYQSLKFPEKVSVGLGIQKMGNTSIAYRLSVFSESKQKADSALSASTTMIFVVIDKTTGKPAAIPEAIRARFSDYMLSQSDK